MIARRMRWFLGPALAWMIGALPPQASARGVEQILFGLEPGIPVVVLAGDSIVVEDGIPSSAGVLAVRLPSTRGVAWIPLALQIVPPAAFVGPFVIQIPEALGRQGLDLVDARGRPVRRLPLSGTGKGTVVWDGRGGSGEWLPPGRYLVLAGSEGTRVAGWVTLAW